MSESGSGPASPCISNCCLNELGVCVGCGRTMTEISGWICATEEEREEILRRATSRLVGLEKRKGESL